MRGVVVTSLVALFAFIGGSAQAATPPSVVSESAAEITSTDAMLEASLDSGSAAPGAYYQFQLSESATEFPEDLSCPPPPSSGPFLPCEGPESADALPIGKIAHADGASSVALDLADAGLTLQPGRTYYFRVVVASAVSSEDTIEWEEPVVAGGVETFATPESSSPLLVTGESVSGVTSSDATLEASIDAGGGTYYQFQLAEFPTEFPDELSCPPPPVLGLPACVGPSSDTALPIGYSGGSGQVALKLADAGVTLKPGTTYYFQVVVAAAKQTEDSVEWEKPAVAGGLQTFRTASLPEAPTEQPASGGTAAQLPAPLPAVHRRHHRHHHHHRHAAHRRHRTQAVALARIAR